MKTNIRFKRYIKNDLSQKKELVLLKIKRNVWYLNDQPLREDGPAIEYENGAKSWFVKGAWYREEKDYWKAVKNLKLEKNSNR